MVAAEKAPADAVAEKGKKKEEKKMTKEERKREEEMVASRLHEFESIGDLRKRRFRIPTGRCGIRGFRWGSALISVGLGSWWPGLPLPIIMGGNLSHLSPGILAPSWLACNAGQGGAVRG